MSENDVAANPTCTPQGELRGLPCVFVVDSAAFPSIPGTTVALLSMAHAAKVARQWVEAHVI
jgi:choline dehydrogenase-like flavoprotein